MRSSNKAHKRNLLDFVWKHLTFLHKHLKPFVINTAFICLYNTTCSVNKFKELYGLLNIVSQGLDIYSTMYRIGSCVKSALKRHLLASCKYKCYRLQSTAVAVAKEPFLSGSNSNYVEEMYASWLDDPKSVHRVSFCRPALTGKLRAPALHSKYVIIESKRIALTSCLDHNTPYIYKNDLHLCFRFRIDNSDGNLFSFF